MAVSLSQRLLPALPRCYWEPLGSEGWWGWARAHLGTFPTGGAQALEVGSLRVLLLLEGAAGPAGRGP